MRVLFLTHRLEAPSVRWRIGQWIPFLRRQGIECAAEPLAEGWRARRRQVESARDYDAVVLQKRMPGAWALRRLRARARRLAFEFDDAIPLASRTRARRFERVLRACDAVITSTEYLADLARPHLGTTPLLIVPNATDPQRWIPREDWSSFRVLGWNGSGGNLPHLESILPQVRSTGLTIRALTDAPRAPDGVELRAFDPAREAEEVRAFDAGLAPLPDDPWTRGKCPVKVLAYMASAVPVIAADVPPHRMYVRDGENGLLVAPDGWRTAVERLRSDPALRQRLARAGRAAVETEFHIERAAARVADLLRRIA